MGLGWLGSPPAGFRPFGLSLASMSSITAPPGTAMAVRPPRLASALLAGAVNPRAISIAVQFARSAWLGLIDGDLGVARRVDCGVCVFACIRPAPPRRRATCREPSLRNGAEGTIARRCTITTTAPTTLRQVVAAGGRKGADAPRRDVVVLARVSKRGFFEIMLATHRVRSLPSMP